MTPEGRKIVSQPELYLEKFLSEVPWERRPDAPRYESWQLPPHAPLRPYTYGKGRGVRTYVPVHYVPVVENVASMVQRLLGVRFDGCFLNRYDNARDWLGWHADDSPEMDNTCPIPIVSFGATREIQFRRKDRSGEVMKVDLTSGSMLVMPPGFQLTHEHRIPKSGAVVGQRVSLTFRGLV